MIRSLKGEAIEPRRIVVELSREEFERFNAFCGRIPPADLLRTIAIRLAPPS